MKNTLIIAAIAVGLTAISTTTSFAGCGACGGGASASKEGDSAVASHDESKDHEHTVEVGCAGCIYGKEGVKGCKTAVKVHDDIYMLKGAKINAHQEGLCKAAKQGKVVGHIEGDNFVASSAELE